MIVASLLLILVAVTLLVLGLTGGSSGLLISSIVASLLAAVFLVVGARQSAAARRAAERPVPGEPGYGTEGLADDQAVYADPEDAVFLAEPEYAAAAEEVRRRHEAGPHDDLPPGEAAFAAESARSSLADRRETVQFDSPVPAGDDRSYAAHPADVAAGDLSVNEAHVAGRRDTEAAFAADPVAFPATGPGAASGRPARDHDAPDEAYDTSGGAYGTPAGDYDAARSASYDAPGSDHDAARGGSYDAARGGDYDAPRGGDYDAARGGDYDAARGGDHDAARGGDHGAAGGGDHGAARGGDHDRDFDRIGPDFGEFPGAEQDDHARGRGGNEDADYDRAFSAINAARSESPGDEAWRRGPAAADDTADPDAWREPALADQAGAGASEPAGASDLGPVELGEADADDPADEPLPQAVRPADAVRVARLDNEVLVVDGRPRYHLADCTHLAGRLTEPIPVDEAVELGFSPCGLCRPVDRLVAAAARR